MYSQKMSSQPEFVESEGMLPSAEDELVEYGPHLPVNEPEKKPRKKRAKNQNTSRSNIQKPPARPHKKLAPDVLTNRFNDLNKKRALLNSKLVILVDRLESYEKEIKTREQEGQSTEN